MFDIITSNLRKIPALSQFTDIQIKTLLDNIDCNFVDYEVNQTIIHEGAINNNIYIVIDGKLGNFINKWLTNGHIELSVDELDPGDVFGDININKALPRGHVGTIRTFEKSTLLKIDRWLLNDYRNQQNEINLRPLNQQNEINLIPLLVENDTIRLTPH